MHYAACLGHLSVCKELLQRMEGDVNPPVSFCVYPSTPLEFAFLNDHLDVIQLILDHIGYVPYDEWMDRGGSPRGEEIFFRADFLWRMEDYLSKVERRKQTVVDVFEESEARILAW